jgi:hypothetical protein
MSYVSMDHAGWVAGQIEASKRQRMTKKDERLRADHKGWHAAPDKLNPFQVRAFDLLGIVGGGIYNAPILWETMYWSPRSLIMQWRGGLGTWDFSQLTWFTFLCHAARIRGYLAPGAPRHIEVSLHERSDEGTMSVRHPNLEEAVDRFWREFSPTHSIVYRARMPAELAAG